MPHPQGHFNTIYIIYNIETFEISAHRDEATDTDTGTADFQNLPIILLLVSRAYLATEGSISPCLYKDKLG